MDDILKECYVRDITENLMSDEFSVNMILKTKSDKASQILKLLFTPENIRLNPDASLEFMADIDSDIISLYDRNNKIIDENKYWGITVYLLKRYFNQDRIILPVSVSETIEKLSINLELSIIYGGPSKNELIQDAKENDLYIQKRLMSDPIFYAVSLLDYLNYNKISFKALISSIPDAYTSIGRINDATFDEDQVLTALSDNTGHLSFNNGIKIFNNKGWILVIPENSYNAITIITESQSFEAAEELCFDALEKIKTCKNQKNSV